MYNSLLKDKSNVLKSCTVMQNNNNGLNSQFYQLGVFFQLTVLQRDVDIHVNAIMWYIFSALSYDYNQTV